MGATIPVEEAERFKMYKYKGYTYFQTPDGEDLPKKFLFLGKYALGAAVVLGMIDANAGWPVATVWKERLYRTTKYIAPLVGMAGAYCCTAYYATLLRKKDDEVNHILAGLAAGAVLGAASGSSPNGIFGGLFLAFIGGSVKYAKMYNYKIGPEGPRRHYSSYYMRKFNTSLVKDDIRGNWTRELPQGN